MEQYNVTGMSCAACSARVEKAVSKVPGVTACSVSLLTNSMGVEGTASPQDDRRRRAGTRATARRSRARAARTQSPSAAEEQLEDHETPKLRRRLLWSLGFLLVLMYFSMGHMMWGWPLPSFYDGQSCGDGSDAAAADGHHHGHQPEILHQRLQGAAAPRAEHGYARGARRDGRLRLQHLRPLRHDRRAGARRRGRGHALYDGLLL